MALNNLLAASHEGKQIAVYRISYQKRDMVVKPSHYRGLTVKRSFDAKNRYFTYHINSHQLIEQFKKAHSENRLPERLKVLGEFRLLIIDEIGCL